MSSTHTTGSNGDWRPRKHDHLVEPVFGGLGVGEAETDADGGAEASGAVQGGGWLRRLLGGLRRSRRERGV